VIICPACLAPVMHWGVACWSCVACGHVVHDLGASWLACWRQYVLDAVLASGAVDTGLEPVGATRTGHLRPDAVHARAQVPAAGSGNARVEALAAGPSRAWREYHFPSSERADVRAAAQVELVRMLEERLKGRAR